MGVPFEQHSNCTDHAPCTNLYHIICTAALTLRFRCQLVSVTSQSAVVPRSSSDNTSSSLTDILSVRNIVEPFARKVRGRGDTLWDGALRRGKKGPFLCESAFVG